MMNPFKKRAGGQENPSVERAVRHSRGWGEFVQHLKNNDGLRVLDFGATSPANINYLTALGHSVYMANVVSDAAKPEWQVSPPPNAPKNALPSFDVERFAATNLDFSGREFDVILLWDTANYLPPALTPVLFARLTEVLRPNGRLLAFFQSKTEGPETVFARYQLTDSDDLVVLRSGPYPVQAIYQTRQIEKFLDGFASRRFFLGKDNIREVSAVR